MRRLLPLSLAALALTAACSRSPDVAAHAAATTVRASAAGAAEERYSVYGLDSRWRDQAGDTLRLPALAGRVRVVAFVYTSCHTTCPLILRDLKAIEAALPESRRDDVGFVLVSIEPQRDTPGRLAEWAEETRLDPAQWTLLNGSDENVRELAATLDVRYQAQPDGEVAHTNAIHVLDARGALASPHEAPTHRRSPSTHILVS